MWLCSTFSILFFFFLFFPLLGSKLKVIYALLSSGQTWLCTNISFCTHTHTHTSISALNVQWYLCVYFLFLNFVKDCITGWAEHVLCFAPGGGYREQNTFQSSIQTSDRWVKIWIGQSLEWIISMTINLTGWNKTRIFMNTAKCCIC